MFPISKSSAWKYSSHWIAQQNEHKRFEATLNRTKRPEHRFVPCAFSLRIVDTATNLKPRKMIIIWLILVLIQIQLLAINESAFFKVWQ